MNKFKSKKNHPGNSEIAYRLLLQYLHSIHLLLALLKIL